ncbi:hypothetical protein [Legionella jordanis]|uniref:hypothetical protein n=1 Tax=Legionella jordanis TaxID=456 RepID=UPI000AC2DC0F|nr:hypothetical protein [Legionella jordanis]
MKERLEELDNSSQNVLRGELLWLHHFLKDSERFTWLRISSPLGLETIPLRFDAYLRNNTC